MHSKLDMPLTVAVRLGLSALRRNLTRTLLTMLAVMIGVAAVIAIVALGTGAKQTIEDRITSAGANMVVPYTTVRKGLMGVTYLDRITLSASSPDLVSQVTDRTTSPRRLWIRSTRSDLNTEAVMPGLRDPPC